MVSAHTTAAIMILTSEKILEVHRLIISNFGEERIIQMLLRIASYQCKVDEINIWLLENTDKL